MKDGCLSAQDTGKKFLVLRLLYEDTQILVYTVLCTMYTYYGCELLTERGLGAFNKWTVTIGAVVLLGYALIYWRIRRARMVTHHGLWVKAQITKILRGIRGSSHVYYIYEIGGSIYDDWKELGGIGDPTTIDLLVHRTDHKVNMVLRLPEEKFYEVWLEKRPDDPCPRHAIPFEMRRHKKKSTRQN